MKDVKILGLTIKLYGNRDWDEDYDFGGITLSREGREYMLDVCQTYTNDESGDCEITCDLEVDKEVFEDCKYDLEPSDLICSDLKATFYILVPNEIESMTLFVKIGDMTKAIELEED